MGNAPSISVVMPVYNGAKYLRQAIASIRWQTFTDWELICVDDGSTDETANILRQFAAIDPRIRPIHQKNQGIVAALNTGVQAAVAPWIARMDADDLAAPTRLATQHAYVQSFPDTVVLGSWVLQVDPVGQPIAPQCYLMEHGEIEQALINGNANSFAHPSVLIKRNALNEVGGYRSEYEWVEDLDLWLRLASKGRLANVPEVLLHYRQHDQSVCWQRRQVQSERRRQLLAEVRSQRGLPVLLDATTASPRKPSPAAGKWARRAARAGNYGTAFRHWRNSVRTKPVSWYSARITLETLLRAATALFAKQKVAVPQLPDWHQWDDPRTSANIHDSAHAA